MDSSVQVLKVEQITFLSVPPKHLRLLLSKVGTFLPCRALQDTNEFPVYPLGQLHIGIWLITSHIALLPQVFGHGFMHFFPIHI